MRFQIVKMILENFKGIKERTIDFSGNIHKIEGKNASGKTTIATAYFWVFCNTDYELKSNPAIFPVDVEECTPSVTIEMLVDSKPMKICKKQSRKITESNGTKKIALTNSYFVNDVPMAERDMVKKLTDVGFDFENFAILANPNAFLLEKKDEQRKILFSMVAAYTDLDIANKMDGVDEARNLLSNYSIDEIKAMQNATLKKIVENYGKKGELLTAKIEGLELSKVDMDFSALELQKNMLTEQLEKNRAAQRVGVLINNELTQLREQDMKLQFELSGIKQKEQAEKKAAEEKIISERRVLQEKLLQIERDISRWNNEVDIHGNSITRLETSIKQGQDAISKIEAEVFDETTAVCPVCHRVYESDKIEEMKTDFEADKLRRIADLHKEITEFMSMLAIKRTERTEKAKNIQKAMNDKADIETALKQPLDALQGNMEEPHTYDAEIERINQAIADNNRLIETKRASMPNMAVLGNEETELSGQIRNTEIQLSKADDNCRIDDKIADLRKQQMVYEQDRANAEKILYQLDLIQKEKNLVVTEEINKHFSLVKWKMFDYLKNGSYTETCIPMVGDKELGAALNNAMQIRAKIDICDSLQKFYDTHNPVFLDNAEALDSENQGGLVADTQLVLLTVKD